MYSVRDTAQPIVEEKAERLPSAGGQGGRQPAPDAIGQEQCPATARAADRPRSAHLGGGPVRHPEQPFAEQQKGCCLSGPGAAADASSEWLE